MALVLTHDAHDVRAKLARRVCSGGDVLTEAMTLYGEDAAVLSAVSGLLREMRGNDDAASSIEPGWWSRTVGMIADAYGWSEDAIMALPLVRLRAYQSAIAAGRGVTLTMYLPPLREEEELKILLQKRKGPDHGR